MGSKYSDSCGFLCKLLREPPYLSPGRPLSCWKEGFLSPNSFLFPGFLLCSSLWLQLTSLFPQSLAAGVALRDSFLYWIFLLFDNREHGGVPQWSALPELGMKWGTRNPLAGR